MLTRMIPADWRGLQNEVARVLRECGFSTQVEAKVETSRGVVELDVLAVEETDGRRYTVACECKHWKTSRVPQTVVHGFRTVTAEMGAHVGYIISLAGFQSGAHTASQLTNVRLATWEEFLSDYELTWFDNFFTHEIDRRLSSIMTYAEPFLPPWYSELSESGKLRYGELKRQYDIFGNMVQSFGPWTRMLRKSPPPQLPISARELHPEAIRTIPGEILNEPAYREFLELCTQHGEAAIADFRELRQTTPTGRTLDQAHE